MTQLGPVIRRTVSEEIRERLIASIRSGEFAPGQRLPPERVLCTEFGVGRTSVREALQGLASLGAIERRGNAMRVAERLPDVVIGSPDGDPRKERVRALFEVRRVIELPMAEFAAARAEAPLREELLDVAGSFSASMPLEDFQQLDRRFHALVSLACGNPLLAELYAKVLDALFSSEDFRSLLYAEANDEAVQRIIGDAAATHQAIASAIATGEPVATAEAVERHLTEVEQRMLAQLR